MFSWAAWEEKQGCGGEAARILEALEEGHPRLVTILLRRVSGDVSPDLECDQ